MKRLSDAMLPILTLIFCLCLWEFGVRWAEIPSYTLPTPSLIFNTLLANWASLADSWWFTIKITFGALLLACAGGILIASIFSLSPSLERAFFPIAVVLQVTPIVAVAPLILIYVDSTTAALLLCAWIVAFFPILSNTVIGLRTVDRNLLDLFRLYRANPWQRLKLLRAPSALPYFLAGLKISGGLSLIGAVTAEMVAGAAGRNTGLASRILEASFRTETPKMFAALMLLVLTGVLIFMLFTALSHVLLASWHSAEPMRDQNRNF
ncbi:ABC transporter permease [Zwartia sp.]|uniref:ABC transporter permease n=1 Tax=Zwartia sp. TaxID=2978004 RepID=UPI00271B282F|nr:ABC transporter permease [Zwartia sp.]MDO9023140.1 ABC transporter permease [Zwartia sp.]